MPQSRSRHTVAHMTSVAPDYILDGLGLHETRLRVLLSKLAYNPATGTLNSPFTDSPLDEGPSTRF